MLLTRYSAVSHIDNVVHLLHVTSDSYARGICNPEQLCKVSFRFKMTLGFHIYFQIFGRMTCCKVTLVLVFLQSLTFGHFYIRKSFPKWENLKISNNAINGIPNMVE